MDDNLEYDDMPDYYNASDWLISIPNSEQFPKKQYMRQFLFCEKVVIVSDLDWVYETLDGKDCIIKVNQNNLENIKEAIIKIIRDKNSRKRISENACRGSKTFFFDYYINMKKMESIMISEIKNYGS